MAECVVMGAGGGTKAASGIVESFTTSSSPDLYSEYFVDVSGLEFTPKNISIITIEDISSGYEPGGRILASLFDQRRGVSYSVRHRYRSGHGADVFFDTAPLIKIKANGFSVGPAANDQLCKNYFWVASN